ncbi:hypothetical protein PIB30_043138 [Stylosanthes scabra]|uniref:Uncharacterized protein n=1 Tax=Stylosanthes scabra TaxID=79078 RepID=A0ABU6XD91_9FABA|nr:hypothetical protein [Stylosanthes scabra]
MLELMQDMKETKGMMTLFEEEDCKRVRRGSGGTKGGREVAMVPQEDNRRSNLCLPHHCGEVDLEVIVDREVKRERLGSRVKMQGGE